MRISRPLLIITSILSLSSCLKTSEYDTTYTLVNKLDTDLQMERYSSNWGSWDENFSDTIDTLTFARDEELRFQYYSKVNPVNPFGGTDSLVFTDGDSIRLVFTPGTAGKNPFWSGYYMGGFVLEKDWVLYHEFSYYFMPEDLPGADSLTSG